MEENSMLNTKQKSKSGTSMWRWRIQEYSTGDAGTENDARPQNYCSSGETTECGKINNDFRNIIQLGFRYSYA